jgi:thiol-disulfide isomerase/thioredoxin
MRAPPGRIPAPLFPRGLPWVNAASAPATLQRGKPLLVEFWDFCRPNSIRTLPYLKAWHERYGEEGLRIVGVHSPGFDPSRSEEAVRAAVARLGIEYPVLIDTELALWQDYENEGWPARYLFDGHACLFEYHFGEGGYAETELAIQELTGVERDPLPALRPEDEPGVLLAPPTADQPGAYRGPYAAGGVWAVLDGAGEIAVAGGPGGSIERTVTVPGPGAYPLLEHERHTEGELRTEAAAGVDWIATCFTPGVAADAHLPAAGERQAHS